MAAIKIKESEVEHRIGTAAELVALSKIGIGAGSTFKVKDVATKKIVSIHTFDGTDWYQY